MQKLTVKIKKTHPDAVIPQYAHGPAEDAGMDLVAVESVLLYKGVPTLVSTGLTMELPPGYEAQIRPRSGLAYKHGLTIPNSPGTIDPSYRGDIKVLLVWHGHKTSAEGDNYLALNKGERVAQMVVAQYVGVEFEQQSDLTETARGVGGCGSTGK